MNRNVLIMVFAGLMLFSACKSNKEAYTKAFQRMKEKESANQQEQAQEAKSESTQVLNGIKVELPTVKPDNKAIVDTTTEIKSEVWTLILGKETNLNTYNVVVGTYVNRTNSTSFYKRLVEESRPASLVQNQEKLYRIVAVSTATLDDAKLKLQELQPVYPKALILIRK